MHTKKLTEYHLFYWGYFLIGALANFSIILLSFLFYSKGMEDLQVAILLSSVYLAALFIPVIGYLTDITDGPKHMLKRVSLGLIVVSILLFFTNNFYLLFILTFLFSISRNATFPLFDNLALDYAHTHNILYGKMRKGGSIGFGIGALLAAPFIILFGMNFIIILPIILATIFYIFLYIMDFDIASSHHTITFTEYKDNFKLLIKSKKFFLLMIIHLLLMGLCSLKLSYQSTLLNNLNASALIIVITNFSIVLPEILFISKTESFFKKRSISFILTIALILSIAHALILTFTSSLIVIFIFAILHGLTMSLYIPHFFKYLSSVIPKKTSSTGFIINSTFQSLGSLIINSIIIVPLIARFNFRFSFIVIASLFTINLFFVGLLNSMEKND